MPGRKKSKERGQKAGSGKTSAKSVPLRSSHRRRRPTSAYARGKKDAAAAPSLGRAANSRLVAVAAAAEAEFVRSLEKRGEDEDDRLDPSLPPLLPSIRRRRTGWLCFLPGPSPPTPSSLYLLSPGPSSSSSSPFPLSQFSNQGRGGLLTQQREEGRKEGRKEGRNPLSTLWLDLSFSSSLPFTPFSSPGKGFFIPCVCENLWFSCNETSLRSIFFICQKYVAITHFRRSFQALHLSLKQPNATDTP